MHRSKQFTNRSEHGLSASADSINRTATIHRCSRPHSNTRGTDAGVTTARATSRAGAAPCGPERHGWQPGPRWQDNAVNELLTNKVRD